MTNETGDRELVLTRLMDAPPDKVYRAWTEPELVKQWFAPAPWTIARAEMDVRPGGASLVVMRSPEGNEMPCPGVFLEVVPNRRLVYAWKGGDERNTGYGAPLDTVVTWSLTPVEAGTRIRLVHAGFVIPRNESAYTGMSGGWKKVVRQLDEISGEDK